MANRDLAPWRGSPLGRTFSDPFLSFRQEMDRLFEDFFAPTTTRASSGNGDLLPSIELKESDKGYTVSAELPGLEMKDVNVDLNDNVLSITGEKRAEQQNDEGGMHYSERSFGRFERRIPLPQEIDADKTEAKFKNGVLTIDLPKNPKAQDKKRHIQIKPN